MLSIPQTTRLGDRVNELVCEQQKSLCFAHVRKCTGLCEYMCNACTGDRGIGIGSVSGGFRPQSEQLQLQPTSEHSAICQAEC